MVFKTRFLHLDLKTHSHSIGETPSELMDVKLSPDEIARRLLTLHNGSLSGSDVIFINMPYDRENHAQGWMVTNPEDENSIKLYYYPERFANALHRSTFDYIILSGNSPEPVYIYLSDMLVLFENPEDIAEMDPAVAAEKLVENHPWVEPEVMISGSDSTLYFISDRFSLPSLGALFAAKKMLALVVDGTNEDYR